MATTLPSGHKVCLNHVAYNFTGKESTPQGLGYCAEAEEIGKVMVGRDKHMWSVGIKNSMKVWVRIPDQMVARKEVAPLAAQKALIEAAEEKAPSEASENVDAAADADADADAAEDDAESKTEAPEPVAPVAAKKKAAPKKKAVPVEKKEKDADSDTASEGTTASEKKKREPTAYNIFIKSKIAEMRVANPGLAQKEYMMQAAAAWNEHKVAQGMPATKPRAPKEPKEKVPKEKKEKKNAKKEKDADSDTASEGTTASEKKKREPTAYNIFIKSKIAEMRVANPGLAQKEYMMQAAAAWNEHKVAQGMPATKPRAPKEPKEPKVKVPKEKKAKA